MIKYDTGKYVWVYEQPMLKSFDILLEVWKVLLIASFVPITMMVVFALVEGSGLEGILFSFQLGALVFSIIFVLSIPAYWIVTRANNGKYTVLFEMDEFGISHTQVKTEKAKLLEALTVMAGAATRNYTAMGAGVNAAAGSSLYSSFPNVRELRAYPEKNTIAVNGKLIRNKVYVDSEDFDFVWEFIKSHAVNATVKREYQD